MLQQTNGMHISLQDPALNSFGYIPRRGILMDGSSHNSFCLFVCLFVFFCHFRAIPMAYGGSQARSQIRAVAAGLHHSHSNTGSEPHLKPIPQLMASLDP